MSTVPVGQLLEAHARIRELEARVKELEAGMARARDNFEETERYMRMLGRHVTSRSLGIAWADAAMLLAAPEQRAQAQEVLEQRMAEAEACL